MPATSALEARQPGAARRGGHPAQADQVATYGGAGCKR
jgi:hypothetical protein